MGLILKSCGTLFIDLDGTILNCSTDAPNPFAVERINKAYDDGFMIVLTTYRGEHFADNSRFGLVTTHTLLRNIGLKFHHIIFSSPSPRVVINDEGAVAVQHPRDGSWEGYEF